MIYIVYRFDKRIGEFNIEAMDRQLLENLQSQGLRVELDIKHKQEKAQ